jgi:type I restriction enzyme S subunit
MLNKIQIPLPPLSIQQKIVAKLDAIFAEIDKATAAAEANAKNAETLFQSYLTQVFERDGKVWNEIKVAELGRVQSGGTPAISKKDYWGDEVEWFSSGELNELKTISSIRRITSEGLKNSNAKVFPVNSLLIGMYDTAAMKMSLLSKPAAFNQAIVGIEPTDKINMVFLYYSLTYIKPYVLSLRRGVRQKNLSLAKIKDLTIKLPSIAMQIKVAEKLKIFKEISNNLRVGYFKKINQNLSFKQSILKQAFNGELVKE